MKKWFYLTPYRRMLVLIVLAVAFMLMACSPDPSTPNFNPSFGDAMGISDLLGDVTRHATGQ